MNDIDFAELSGYLRVLEKRLLTGADIENAVLAANEEDFLRALQNGGYDFSRLSAPEDYEDLLRAALKSTYAELYRLSPVREVVDLATAKYDYHNLKAALKGKYAKNADFSARLDDYSAINPTEIAAFVAQGDKKNLPAHIIEAALEAAGAFEKSGSPQEIDLICDRRMFEYLLNLCEELGNGFITDYHRHLIDFYNIKALLRAKSMGKTPRFTIDGVVDGGFIDAFSFKRLAETPAEEIGAALRYKYLGGLIKNALDDYAQAGNYALLEREMDNFLMEYLKKTRFISYGAENLFAYLMLKESEVRQLRLVWLGRINEIPPETLKERLRENYA